MCAHGSTNRKAHSVTWTSMGMTMRHVKGCNIQRCRSCLQMPPPPMICSVYLWCSRASVGSCQGMCEMWLHPSVGLCPDRGPASPTVMFYVFVLISSVHWAATPPLPSLVACDCTRRAALCPSHFSWPSPVMSSLWPEPVPALQCLTCVIAASY